jgi:hypothetical protein
MYIYAYIYIYKYSNVPMKGSVEGSVLSPVICLYPSIALDISILIGSHDKPVPDDDDDVYLIDNNEGVMKYNLYTINAKQPIRYK